MTTLVVPDVCRYSLNASFAGRTITNTFDLIFNTAGSTTSRQEAIADTAELIWDNWCDDVLVNQVNNYGLVNLTWLDLDSASGSTGGIAGTGSNALPQVGGDAASPFPGNVSVLVRRSVDGDRSHRAGRLYVAGYAENRSNDANPNELDAANLAVLASDFNDFFAHVEQNFSASPSSYESHFVVTHILTRDGDGHPLTGDYAQCTSFDAQAVLATQRRRLRP